MMLEMAYWASGREQAPSLRLLAKASSLQILQGAAAYIAVLMQEERELLAAKQELKRARAIAVTPAANTTIAS